MMERVVGRFLTEQGLHSITGVAAGQHHHDMVAHFTLLYLLVVKETENVGVASAAVNGLQQFKHFCTIQELLLLYSVTVVDGLCVKEHAQLILLTCLFQLIEAMACRVVEIEGEAHHLRETVVGVLPVLFHFLLTLLKVVLIPLLLGLMDVVILNSRYDVLFLKLMVHQYAVGCAGKMQPDTGAKPADGSVQLVQPLVHFPF